MTDAANRSRPPIHNSYWVIPGRFAAGEYPGDFDPVGAGEKLRGLLEEGINHFIDPHPGQRPPWNLTTGSSRPRQQSAALLPSTSATQSRI